MKKYILIGIVVGIAILGVAGFLLLNSDSDNTDKLAEQIKNTKTEIVCEDYDDDKEQCLLHYKCEWMSDENLCDLIDE